jgi:hypothetical protein
MKHTPGPWRIGSLKSFDGYTGQPFRNVWAGHNDAATVVARAIRTEGAMTNDVDADANLIAAAPDLLQALKKLLEFVEGAAEGKDSFYWDEINKDEGSAARAAIAKATGESRELD